MNKEDNKREKEKHYNLGDNEKEQLRKYRKEAKKVMRDNLYDEKRSIQKKRTTKEKKNSVTTLVMMKKNS